MTNMTVKKERKGKERKGKGLLYLIAIAILISLVFTACSKKRTTAPEDLTPTPISDTSTGQTPTLTWGQCSTLNNLYNNYYTFYKSANGDTLEITSVDNVKYNGNKTYGLGAGGNRYYKSSDGAEFRFGSENGLSERFVEFKPSDKTDYIKFSLQKKP